jgi:aryl-alcohol dehydrogenase-like predicted oxidoreductase
MQYIQLGGSSISVSRVGVGTMGLGGYFDRDDSTDLAVVSGLNYAISQGINLIDTAEIYGAGHSEELVGQAIRNCRSEVVVATKFSPENSSSIDVIKAAERSLVRLKTDYIDLYQTHWPNIQVGFDETMEALHSLLESGKVRAVGLSNASAMQMKLMRSSFRPSVFVSLQQQYNLADRYVESTHLPFCEDFGCSLLAYSPLLEGKMVPEDERIPKIRKIADECGLGLGEMVLSWLLRRPEVVVIPKASKREHLDSNLRASELVLSPSILNAIDQLYPLVVVHVNSEQVEVSDVSGRRVYKTVEEALENTLKMNPSPSELAAEIRLGADFKPIKVRRVLDCDKDYVLTEGRLRYWAWVIAFGCEKQIPCLLV